MYLHAKNQVLVNTVYQLMNLAIQIHSFLLHKKTRLQQYARNMCELATTQFDCRCFHRVVYEQTKLLLLIRRPPLPWLVTHKGQNTTQPLILVKNTIATNESPRTLLSTFSYRGLKCVSMLPLCFDETAALTANTMSFNNTLLWGWACA
jgi:hypothetical protein